MDVMGGQPNRAAAAVFACLLPLRSGSNANLRFVVVVAFARVPAQWRDLPAREPEVWQRVRRAKRRTESAGVSPGQRGHAIQRSPRQRSAVSPVRRCFAPQTCRRSVLPAGAGRAESSGRDDERGRPEC